MRALRLDYRAHDGLRTLSGFLMLFMALILAGTMAWYFNTLRQETSRVESLVGGIETRTHGQMTASDVSRMEPEKLAEVVKFSNHVIHQLNLPWDKLFAQLEEAKGENVALLGVEPDVNSPVIKVVGEARDYAEMLQYVRSLSEQQGVLQSVYLDDHKMDDQNPDKPIRFTLEAAWAAK